MRLASREEFEAVGDDAGGFAGAGFGGDEGAEGGAEVGERFEAARAEGEEGGGEGVALGGGGCDDGGELRAAGGLAGARVEDVAVGATVGHEGFTPNGGDGEGVVAQGDDGEDGGARRSAGLQFGVNRGRRRAALESGGPLAGRRRGGVFGRVDSDVPRVGVGGVAEGADGAGAAVEEGVGDAEFPEDFRGAFEGKAFADGAEVELHAGAQETDGEIFGIEVDVFHADAVARGGELGCGGDASARAGEAPGAQERGDGDVEGAGGGAVELRGAREEVEDGGFDGDGFVKGAGVEAADLAAGMVAAEFGAEAFDFSKSLLGGGAQRDGARAVQDDLEARGHRVAREGNGGGRGFGAGFQIRILAGEWGQANLAKEFGAGEWKTNRVSAILVEFGFFDVGDGTRNWDAANWVTLALTPALSLGGAGTHSNQCRGVAR